MYLGLCIKHEVSDCVSCQSTLQLSVYLIFNIQFGECCGVLLPSAPNTYTCMFTVGVGYINLN